MMKRVLIIFSFVGLMFSAHSARADIEALEAVITAVGDVVASAKDQVVKAQDMIESMEQLKTQVKSAVNDVKKTVNDVKGVVDEAKNTVDAVKEKAQGIVDEVNNTLTAVQNKDFGALKDKVSNLELAGLNGTFDGTKDDEDMAEAVMENMVRKKGEDSIANQKALSQAINQKNGIDMTNMFAKAMVLRQNLLEETDETENPETIDEAVSLAQQEKLSAMRRRNKILNMEATISRFRHAQEMENIQGDYEEAQDE